MVAVQRGTLVCEVAAVHGEQQHVGLCLALGGLLVRRVQDAVHHLGAVGVVPVGGRQPLALLTV
jgi:hypothetical protein